MLRGKEPSRHPQRCRMRARKGTATVRGAAGWRKGTFLSCAAADMRRRRLDFEFSGSSSMVPRQVITRRPDDDDTQRHARRHRPDVGTILVSPWIMGTPQRQRDAVDASIAKWKIVLWPHTFLSLNCFVSADGAAEMNYAQWTDDAHREFARTYRGPWCEASMTQCRASNVPDSSGTAPSPTASIRIPLVAAATRRDEPCCHARGRGRALPVVAFAVTRRRRRRGRGRWRGVRWRPRNPG